MFPNIGISGSSRGSRPENVNKNGVLMIIARTWRLEDIKDMLNNGDSGDANVEDQISESDSRTKQILKMFQVTSRAC